MDMPKNSSEGHELIAFRLGKQEYCINVMMVREIRGWTAATVLPRVPRYIKGVINLSGAILPIVDLAVRLGMTGAEPTARNVIIVIQIFNRQVGILVDAVSDILIADNNKIQALPDFTSDVAKNFLKGLIPVDKRMISLITLDNVLSIEELEAA